MIQRMLVTDTTAAGIWRHSWDAKWLPGPTNLKCSEKVEVAYKLKVLSSWDDLLLPGRSHQLCSLTTSEPGHMGVLGSKTEIVMAHSTSSKCPAIEMVFMDGPEHLVHLGEWTRQSTALYLKIK